MVYRMISQENSRSRNGNLKENPEKSSFPIPREAAFFLAWFSEFPQRKNTLKYYLLNIIYLLI